MPKSNEEDSSLYGNLIDEPLEPARMFGSFHYQKKSAYMSFDYCISGCKCTTRHEVKETSKVCLRCGVVKPWGRLVPSYNPTNTEGIEKTQREQLDNQQAEAPREARQDQVDEP